MLPSSISPAEARARARMQLGLQRERHTYAPAQQHTEAAAERGPLGRAAARVLGLGGYQAFQSWAQLALERVFAPSKEGTSTPRAIAWLAARLAPGRSRHTRQADSALMRAQVTGNTTAGPDEHGPFSSMARLAYERTRRR